MRFANAWSAGAVGIGVTWLSGQVAPPPIGIALGAFVTVLAMLLVEEWPRYALAGTVYALGLAAVIALGGLGGEYARTPLFSLLGFGGLSAVIIVVRSLGRRGVGRLTARVGDEQYTEDVYTAVSAGAGAASMIWTVLTAQEKAARYGGIAGAGTLGFTLNLLGIELPIPFWLLEGGLDATMVTFVGSVVAGFHVLSTISAMWRAAKTSATKSKAIGSRAASTASAAAESAGESVAEKANTAVEAANERVGRDE